MKSKSQNHFMPKLKFKSFISNWEKVLLGELSTKVNQKNNDFFYDQVLTNSATIGFSESALNFIFPSVKIASTQTLD